MKGSSRISVAYALLFTGTGVSLPYLSLWLRAEGLSGADIGVILAAPMLARIVTGPLLAVWADSFQLRRTAVAVLASVTFCAYVGMALTRGFAAWLPLWFVAASCLGAILPLLDVFCLRRSRKDGFDYARPRGIGSLAFVAANVAMGALLAIYTTELIIVWVAVVNALLALAAWRILPDEPVADDGVTTSHADRFAGLGRLLGDPTFMTAIVSLGLIQAAHAFYYGFSILSWKAQGVPQAWHGLLWATGVAAEIVFMWFMQPFRRRMGPWRLVMLGGAAAMVRWTAMAFAPPLAWLWPLQMLHAFTFAAAFLGGLQIIEKLTPRESSSAAQTLSSALSSGLLTGLGTIMAGPLYDRYGAGGYLAMTAMAGLGLVGVLRLRRMVEAKG
ncbi:MFS transporter [Caulobacter sp. 17J65-9]|uniref:MFS transporter n=1 Tax=Caulobacter sp. 17J65-9 TaxID=2709382 RepID=UPI0013C975EE|nr:MFS transporter [Caulobacter sp. 17J65-9]